MPKTTKLSPVKQMTATLGKMEAPAPQRILTTLDEIRKFHLDDLAHKKEELEKIVVHLEEVLGPVLSPKTGDEEENSARVGSPLNSEANSPLQSILHDIRSDGHGNYNFLEFIRNRLSGLIDRVNI